MKRTVNVLILGLLAIVLLGIFALPAYAERISDRGYGFHMHYGGVCVEEAAKILGLTREEVIESGETAGSFYNLARDKGISDEDFAEKIRAAREARIDSLVKDGIIDEVQAANALRNPGGQYTRPTKGCGSGMGHHGFRRGRDN